MGVHGLWRLIEPSGKPVPLETLENKILAVDISIWLHQAVKGFQDSKGAPVANAHLLGIYHRVCKLLYFRIKPIFVFDGGVPALKKQTIAKRTQSKLKNLAQADTIQKQLLSTLLKHTAVSKVLTEKIEASIGTVNKVSPKRINKNSLYQLPPNVELDSTISSSEDESYSEPSESTATDSSQSKSWDLHTIDVNSSHFKSLPVDVRHEILTDLKETRKQSSWGKLHELPKVSDDFSVYQLNRLRKRQSVQSALESIEKEMGGKSLSLAELESILKDQGVIDDQDVGNRIAADEITKYLLVKDEKSKHNKLESTNQTTKENPETILDITMKDVESVRTKADFEYENDLKKAIALSLESDISESIEPVAFDGPSTSRVFAETKTNSSKNDSMENAIALSLESDMSDAIEPVASDDPSTSGVFTETKINSSKNYFMENFADADFISSSSDEELADIKTLQSKMSSAQSYMMEYSGLTPNEIGKLISGQESSSAQREFSSEEKTLISQRNLKKLQKDTKITVDKSDVTKNTLKLEKSIEIMSDSSDSNIEENNEKDLNMFIHPTKIFNENNEIPYNHCTTQNVEKRSQSIINIIINPNETPGQEDDLFADIFDSDDKNVNIQTNFTIASELKNIESASKEELSIVRPNLKLNKNDKLTIDSSVKKNQVSELSSKIHATTENVDIKITSKDQFNKSNNDGNTIYLNTTNQKEGPVDNKTIEKKTDIMEGNSANRTDIKSLKNIEKKKMTEGELTKLKEELYKEKLDLINEKSSKERIAGNITDQMYQDAQELLELFGVPYLIAPMEAEAQCAFLDKIGVTDGTITDDSDIWLFGGKTVYKNFFNQSKHVMEYRAEDIEYHFKLTREQMILLALLVGSDYTIGIHGVGPVTAVEILAAFPHQKKKLMRDFSLSQAELIAGLKEFRSWFTKEKTPGPGRSGLKSKLKNITFTENFPSLQVVGAYLEPKVDTSREPFSWNKPNITALMEFAKEKFGWTKNRTEDILNPLMKRIEERRHQKSLKDYFKTRFKLHSGRTESKMSRRVKTAITNMGKDPSEIIAEELEEELKRAPRKKTSVKKNKATKASELHNKIEDLNIETKSPTHCSDQKNQTGNSPKEKLKPSFNNGNDSQECTSQNLEDLSNNTKDRIQGEKLVISDKISQIRKRRKLKEAMAVVKIQKPRLQSKKNKIVSSQLQESLPEDLKEDEEVNLLSQIAIHSSLKVNEIDKTLHGKIDDLNSKMTQISKSLSQSTSGVFNRTPNIGVSNRTPNIGRPLNRPTRVPKKEVIPQKQKDKQDLLRNKLKAIEVLRKGKHGPGYVPKKERKRKLPKAQAELSESSDE